MSCREFSSPRLHLNFFSEPTRHQDKLGCPQQISLCFSSRSPAWELSPCYAARPLPCDSNKCLEIDAALQKKRLQLHRVEREESLASWSASAFSTEDCYWPSISRVPVRGFCLKETKSTQLATPGRTWCPSRGPSLSLSLAILELSTRSNLISISFLSCNLRASTKCQFV